MPVYPPNARETFPEPRRRDRHDPFRELEEMHERMGWLLGRTLGEERGMRVNEGWTPLVDIEETDEEWVFEADLPGARREDLNIEVRDSELAIAGEIKEREHAGALRRRTRRTGRFEYQMPLPSNALKEQVDAKLEHGVLTIRVPRSKPSSAQQVDIRGD